MKADTLPVVTTWLTITRSNVRTVGGYPISSTYAELFWLPILGPTAMWLLRRLDRHLAAGDESQPAVLDETTLSLSLGLGNRTGHRSPYRRALRRIDSFGVVRTDGGTVVVPRTLPRLRAGQVNRLPDALRAVHARIEGSTE